MAATATDLKLTPLGDRVVVQPLGREETTKSGIVLPDTAKEKPQRGTVLAVEFSVEGDFTATRAK